MKNVLRVVCPEVRIPEKVWKRLMAYIEVCPMEVGGLGTVQVRGNILTVTDLQLLEQRVTAAETKIDPGAIPKLLIDWHQQGKDISELKLWWHSHADMEVFWSPKDMDTIRRLSNRGGWFLSIVGNKKRETLTRLTLMSPLPVSLDDVPLIVVPEFEEDLLRAAAEEVKAKVRRKRRFPVIGGGGREPVPAEEAFLHGWVDDKDGTEGEPS